MKSKSVENIVSYRLVKNSSKTDNLVIF